MATKRKFFIDEYSTGTLGCCGIDELHGFLEDAGSRARAPTDDEWLRAICRPIGRCAEVAGPLILFSGSEDQGKYKFSPQGLAKWLVSQREEVVNTPYRKNKNSGNNVQAFLWAISDNFRSRLIEYKEKQEKNGGFEDIDDIDD